MKIKQYELKKVEIGSLDFNEPTETQYFFETHIRRSIRIVPVWTTWNKEFNDCEEEIYRYNVTCVYNCHEYKLEFFYIEIKKIEEFYFQTTKTPMSDFVRSWVNGCFNKRTKEKFMEDYNGFLEKRAKEYE